MTTMWHIIISIGAGLVVAVPFWVITMRQNKKNWAWEESGKYLRGMNRAYWYLATGEFLVTGALAFIVIKGITGEFS